MPVQLLEALALRKDELTDVCVFGGMALYPFSIFKSPDYIGKINYITSFFLGQEKVYYDVGNISLMSVHLSLIGKCMTDVHKINVVMMEVTEPDEEGYLYYGIGSTAVAWDVAQKADKIILQVNKAQPVPSGGINHRIHVSEVTSITEVPPKPLQEFPQSEPTEAERQIAEYLLPYIEDGSTIQIGLGGLSNAVGFGLENRNDLSVHTEMYTDSMVYLSKKGVINGKQWASFALGSRELYEYVHKGPVHFAPFSIINDPVEIGKIPKFVSINTCLAADLTGQVCSEAIGHKQYSATGGQLDFVRGAGMSKGGKSFLCLTSTFADKEGKLHSKIEVSLPKGSIITTPRADVMYIATEYGVADLYLRSVEERVNAMISIAHPDFRDELRAGAVHEGLLRK
jgi:acyl-CoA hydrolase